MPPKELWEAYCNHTVRPSVAFRVWCISYIIYIRGLSGRVLDSRPRGRGFEPHRRHCVVSLSKNINPSLVLIQHRKTRPFITERLLMLMVFGCIFGWRSVYHFRVTVTLISDLVFRIFVSGAYLILFEVGFPKKL